MIYQRKQNKKHNLIRRKYQTVSWEASIVFNGGKMETRSDNAVENTKSPNRLTSLKSHEDLVNKNLLGTRTLLVREFGCNTTI